MINLTVINKKELIKYIFKITFFILIIVLSSNILLGGNNKENLKVDTKEEIKNEWITNFFNKMIPGLEQFYTKDYKEKNDNLYSKINPLEIALKMELGVIDATKKIENIDEEKEKEEEEIEIETSTAIEKVEVIQAKTGLSTEIIPNNVPDKFTDSYNGVKIKNGTDYKLTNDMLKPDVTVNNKNILIFHTHTCESYTASENFNYVQTGNYRTTDYDYNVVRVGTELENQLKSYNYNVIHDKTYHDYPAYNGSYDRSLETVKNILNTTDEQIDVIFDIHRDAIADYSYAPKVKIGDEYAAQLMFVIGSDGGGSEHKNWNKNLKFAIKIQEKANEMYPGLFKAIILRNSRYNQQLGIGASIIEVGATRKYNGRMLK